MMTEYNASIVVESSVRLLHKGIYHHASKEWKIMRWGWDHHQLKGEEEEDELIFDKLFD
jgi:hypothetical protein